LRRIITKEDSKLLQKAAARPEALAVGGAPSKTPETSTPPDNYVSKLSGVIPAEIIAGWTAIVGVLATQTGVSQDVYWAIFVVLLVLTPLYALRASKEKGLPPAWRQVVLATVAFIVWVFALGGPFAFLKGYQSYYGSIVITAYTLAAPLAI